MKIVNPLYDKAFKYLMENTRLAKKVLEVILETEIEELSLEQQETLVPSETRSLTLFLLDFKALIKQPDGSKRQILIELQKSKYGTDIRRFRNYLGANYITKFQKREKGKLELSDEPEIYPIVTIYILGYKLDDLPFLAVTVNNQVINSINKATIDVDSFFVNMLTHRSHILQVTRLPEERKTRLEKFLSLFNQAWYTDQRYILDLQEIPEEFLDIAEYLQIPVMNEEFRRQLAGEEEIDSIFDQQEAKFQKQIDEAKKNEEIALAKEKEALAKEKLASAKEKEERRQKEAALARISESALQMILHGVPINIIVSATGFTRDEIEVFKENL